MRFCSLISAFFVITYSIQISNSKKSFILSSEDDSDSSFLIETVAKYFPDSLIQVGANFVEHFIKNRYDIGKGNQCEFSCQDGSKQFTYLLKTSLFENEKLFFKDTISKIIFVSVHEKTSCLL
jgi:hypothetical protein